MAFSLGTELRLLASVAETGAIDIQGWLKTAQSFVELLEKPPASSGATQDETLVNIMLAQAANYGPSLTTGGQLHAVTQTQATFIAPIISACATQYKRSAALIVAGLQGESRCDPNAVNPNNQDSTPGESAHDKFMHTDIGIAQFDGATLYTDSLFADLQGLSDDEMSAKAYDPAYAIPKFCAFINRLYINTQAEIDSGAVNLSEVPNGDLNVLVLEAYNAGVHGSELIAQRNGLTGNWSYGQGWVNRMNTNMLILSGA